MILQYKKNEKHYIIFHVSLYYFKIQHGFRVVFALTKNTKRRVSRQSKKYFFSNSDSLYAHHYHIIPYV